MLKSEIDLVDQMLIYLKRRRSADTTSEATTPGALPAEITSSIRLANLSGQATADGMLVPTLAREISSGKRQTDRLQIVA
jgi:hypothetical protein